jgi:hypothetical protein
VIASTISAGGKCERSQPGTEHAKILEPHGDPSSKVRSGPTGEVRHPISPGPIVSSASAGASEIEIVDVGSRVLSFA